MTPEVAARARQVRLVLMDVDGVLTDGRLYQFPDGGEAKAFHARDGLGIRLGQRGGIRFAILSGRSSEVVSNRAAELGIERVHQGIADKGACFDTIVRELGLGVEQVCYVGDDLVDVPVLRRAGLSVAPADADAAARDAAHWVTAAPGGRGAIREVVEVVLRAQGRWRPVSGVFLGEG